MTGAAFTALLSHWRRKPGQLLTLILGLALATALWSAVQAINAEARASYDRAATVFGPVPLDRLEHPSGGLTVDDYVALRRAGWQVSPVLEGRKRLGDTWVRVVGVDPLTAPTLPPAFGQAVAESPAQVLSNGIGAAAPETVARLEGVPGLPELRASTDLPPGQLITDIAVAARLLEEPNRLSRLVIAPNQPAGLEPLSTLAPNLTRVTPEPDGDIARLTDSFHLNLTAFGLLSFAVGLFIVHGAVGLAFEQRRSVFRTLRAVGLPASRLLMLLVLELLVLAVFAGALGLALGYLIAGALLPDVAATLRGLYGAEVTGVLAFRPAWALGGIAIAIGGTLVAAAQGLWRVARMPLLAAAQPRAWARVSGRALAQQAIAGVGLVALGIVLQVVSDGLIAGFGLLAGLLLGAALCLPFLLSLALSLGERLARGPIGQWLWADARQQLPGLSLALMALLLALATNIGVGTMVSSFRLTFTGWLDQRLASELYINARNQAEGAALRDWLAGREEVSEVLPIWSAETEIGGVKGEVFSLTDHPTYRENWPLLQAVPDVWDVVASGRGVLINEQTVRRMDWRLGDTVEVLPGWSLPLAGVYSDYGNPVSQAMAATDALLARVPDIPRLRHGVRVAPEDVAGLRSALVADFGLPPEAMIDQAAIKGFSLGVFERTFTVTGALNVLTLSVAGFAILTALLTLASIRLPQLAPVWALGMTRKQLARLEALRALLLAALTACAALPLGLALAWVLLAVVNVEAFGWRLPMFIFPGQWIWLMAAALGAALLAAALPVRRLARMPVARFLQVFAHER